MLQPNELKNELKCGLIHVARKHARLWNDSTDSDEAHSFTRWKRFKSELHTTSHEKVKITVGGQSQSAPTKTNAASNLIFYSQSKPTCLTQTFLSQPPMGSEKNLHIVLLIDTEHQDSGLPTRKQAYEDVHRMCRIQKLHLQDVSFHGLQSSSAPVLELFYNADCAIIDFSMKNQQSILFYHLGIRQSLGMLENVLLYHAEVERDLELSLELSTNVSGMNSVGYNLQTVAQKKECVVVKAFAGKDCTLAQKLKVIIREASRQSKAQAKSKLIADLRKLRDLSREEQGAEIFKHRERFFEDPDMFSADTVVSVLIAYRGLNMFEEMIQLVEKIVDMKRPEAQSIASNDIIKYWYAFSLTRRNDDKKGDRDKALQVITQLIEETTNPTPDYNGLCGRIFKDKFIKSGHSDLEALESAIDWYRKGCDISFNVYTGVNLCTLLVVAGKTRHECTELASMLNLLNMEIGRKGSLESLTDYWDVATYFEISVLSENYKSACEAAKCMFKLNPVSWEIDSTLSNTKLIFNARHAQRIESEQRIPASQ